MMEFIIGGWHIQLKSSITIQDNIARLATQQEELLNEMRRLVARDEECRTSEQNRTDVKKGEKETDTGKQEEKEIGQAEAIGPEVHGHTSLEASREEDQRTHQISTSNHTNQRQTNPFRTQHHTPRHIQPNALSATNLYPGRQYNPLLSRGIQSSSGEFKFTSIGGDQTITDASHHIVNTNSGNTTTTTTTESNNDLSIRMSTGS
jgi:hypothetical protein